jgi:DNA ligase-1
MKAFSEVFTQIDQTTSTNEKIDALVDYFKAAEPKDAIWCVALLTGKRPRRTVKSGELRDWCIELSGITAWLVEESYHVVGDLAETITLLLPGNKNVRDYKLHEVIHALMELQNKSDEERKAYILSMWQTLTKEQLFVFNKLITGAFRVGVSEKIVIKALAKAFEIDENIVAHRLAGAWDASNISLLDLLITVGVSDDISKPYPFYLAYALETPVEELGNVDDWQIERKYDGIRGQIIIRNGELFVWSRGEDLMTEKFIEFNVLPGLIPDGTVIDGEIIPVKDEQLLPFHVMQTRIGRKNISKKFLEEAPLVMICYDLLEYKGEDIREKTMIERRELLEELINTAKQKMELIPLMMSPLVAVNSWREVAEERMKARDFGCEGLMLKRKDSVYKTGRRRGDWWKWKVDPLSIDGVLIYAQRGHGRRANLYTDFTFAVWNGEELVPFTKAYSGLTDKELVEVDNWIKKNTLDKFGPVRSVTPKLVFEIGFEGINPSPRHKSGVALRFPRILRWRKDKAVEEANTKEDLMNILKAQG